MKTYERIMKIFNVKDMDEMERMILIKSMAVTWISLEINLFIFAIVQMMAFQKITLLAAVVLVLAIIHLVQFFSIRYSEMKKYSRLDNGNEE